MSRSFSLRKSHKYDDIRNLHSDLKDIDSRNNPENILNMDLNHFGLYNIDRIKEAISERKLKLSFWEQIMLNRLFEMKEKEKEGDMKGAKKIKQDAINVYKQSKKDDLTAAKITIGVGKSRDLGLSSKITTEVIDAILKSDSTLAESPEFSLTERLARLKEGKGSKSKKRRGTKKRRGRTKRRKRKIYK